MDFRLPGARNPVAPTSVPLANQSVNERDKPQDGSQWHKFTQQVVNGTLKLDHNTFKVKEELPDLGWPPRLPNCFPWT
jgi:hypothetical protein